MSTTIKEDIKLIFVILIFVIGFFLIKNTYTGFTIIEFDINESLDLNESHVIISYGNNSEQRSVEVVNGTIQVDLINLNYTGNVLIGLVVNNSVIETKEVFIDNQIEDVNESDVTIEENITIEENVTNQTQEVIENITVEENVTIEENITIEDTITDEGNVTIEDITISVAPIDITRLSLSERFGKDIRPYLRTYLTNKFGEISLGEIKDISSKNFDVGENLVAVEIEKEGKKITWITTDKKINEIIK